MSDAAVETSSDAEVNKHTPAIKVPKPIVFIDFENASDFNEISRTIEDEYKPGTYVERFMVEQMAQSHWLARRTNSLAGLAFNASWRVAAINFAGIPIERAKVRSTSDGGLIVHDTQTDAQVVVTEQDLAGSQAIVSAPIMATFQTLAREQVKLVVSLHELFGVLKANHKPALEASDRDPDE